MNATRLLQWSLLACTAYFLAMSTAHFIGFKVPVLFVYWDVPSNHYQDMIISFCAFTYATLSFAAYRHRVAVPALLVALVGTVLGLSAVNSSAALAQMIDGGTTTAYWLQTGMIAGLLIWLVVLYRLSRANVPAT
ncbi:hypothetical protein LL252_18635 [Alcanivorax marinus]|jgi:hypothetical protein|uniref:Uncharacterized protein n=2 Tax=Alloalcanivorax TaxID=3020832 RepID=A0A9Q3UQ49_9GAMM|nr:MULTISPECIES: hypothetical protein [Alloalcanivorax]MBF5054624.1 hypothetical protein [Alloalcanivorax venustensis ISO4]MCC4310585.1 hypothetical protein [Alloalcanivorax marinus]SMO94207.1 hypothetical protein SAMN06272769_13312 [Alcanivorax sp. DSM 26295]|tara:strand:- start:3322 stop:3726 length:405 start_codon:yes stop_codon:yes gene_type:complete